MSTDVELWEASCRGERKAFESLVERYEEAVCAITYALTGDRSASEDLAQETFLTAWRNICELREPKKLGGWLCGIARNLGRRAQAKRRVVELNPDRPSPDPTPYDALADQQQEELVWRTLRELPPQYREPLVLFYRDGQSTERVAKLLDLTTAAAQQRLSRGRKLLRQEIESVVETTLESTRSRGHVRRRLAAALPLVSPTQGPPGTSVATLGLGVIAVKYAGRIIAAVAVAAILFLVTRKDSEAPAPDRSAALVTKVDSMASREGGGLELPPTFAARRTQARADNEVGPDERAVALEITRHGPRITVNLDGGPSQLASYFSGESFITIDTQNDPQQRLVDQLALNARDEGATRHVRGRVRDSDGGPIAGAIVTTGEHIQFVGKSGVETHVSADDAATTDDDGRFELEMPVATGFDAVAMHGHSFSRVEHVDSGADAVELDLRIDEDARLRGTIRRAGEGVRAPIDVASSGTDKVSFDTESDLDGAYELNALPPGDYTVRARLTIHAPQRGWVSEDVSVTAGNTTTLDLDLPAGTLVAISVALTAKYSGTTLFNSMLLPGHHDIDSSEDAAAFRLSYEGDDVAYSSTLSLEPESLVDEPTQFPAIAPGPWTACAEIQQVKDSGLVTLAIDCQKVTVVEGQDVAEAELTL